MGVDALQICITRTASLSAEIASARTLRLSNAGPARKGHIWQHFFPSETKSKICGLTLEGQFLGVRIFRVRPCDAARLRRGQFDLQSSGKAGDDLVLHREEIGFIGVEPLRPKMSARSRVNELGVDPHALPLFCALPSST